MGAAFTEEEEIRIREELILSGIRMCRAIGLKKMSVSKLTKAAGIAKGSFYNFFASKEDFILEAVKYSHDGITSLIKKKLAGRKKMTPGEFIEFYMEYLDSEYALIKDISFEDRIWLQEHLRDQDFGTRKRTAAAMKKWLSYVEGIRKDLDMGIVVNLDHAISLMMGKDEAIDEKARKSSVLLMLQTMEEYITGRKVRG